MKYLYAPWRTKYVTDVARKGDKEKSSKECVFCTKLLSDDKESFIFGRYKHCAVLLNLFPYNAGHLLIITLEHKNSLRLLSDDARNELIALTNRSANILIEVLGAEGINIGMNLGKVSGAGIPSHVHQHILPRWDGDTNFLPLLSNTKQISIDLNELYEKLKPYFY